MLWGLMNVHLFKLFLLVSLKLFVIFNSLHIWNVGRNIGTNNRVDLQRGHGNDSPPDVGVNLKM
jgi:hypothetical protein